MIILLHIRSVPRRVGRRLPSRRRKHANIRRGASDDTRFRRNRSRDREYLANTDE